MARYKCPLSTCNFVLNGSVAELTNPAIWHTQGSHNANITENEVLRIVDEQARGVFVNGFIPEVEASQKVNINKWWNKINNL